MNVLRNLLLWILLALVGAAGWYLLAQDPGYVLVRFRGTDYTTTVLWAGAGLLVLAFGLWLLWTLLTLPFRAWRQRGERRSRARLGGGLDSLHQGHYARAEKLLAEDDNPADAAVARIGAARAALARGSREDAERHLDGIDDSHAASRALARAELALADGRPTDALVALDMPGAQPLPPRGLVLRAQALAISGKYADAYGLLGALKQQHAVAAHDWTRYETEWAAGALREAGDSNLLAERWEALPKALRTEPAVARAYARRAADLGWDDAASKTIEQALDARWDEGLAGDYARLPVGRYEHRQATAERWLQAYPRSPALLLGLARLARAQGRWEQAEAYLHRAVEQGAGTEAWEELGHGFVEQGDEARARFSYANALRASRGEPVNGFLAPGPGADPSAVHVDTRLAGVDANGPGPRRDPPHPGG
ncbi:MAG TPA: heme biosynthesis HemY N-terminal domain-containing protein [Luteimonas sp.]|nr:heme biosynthesis HemY N-terminal domain-containing protein [Luteimonas sp.]